MWDIIRVSAIFVVCEALFVGVCIGYALLVERASLFLVQAGWI